MSDVRWFLGACVVCVVACVGARTAAAERVVIMRPTVLECASGRSWTEITDCLKSHSYTASHERTLGAARAVEVRGSWGPSVALFIHRGARWQLGGMFEIPQNEAEFQLLALDTVKSGGQTGYRLDIGVVQPVSVTFDAQTAETGTLLAKHVLLCRGTNEVCTDLVVACDTVVDGLGYSSYHGELKLTDRDVSVVGDPRLAKPDCRSEQSYPLRWEAGAKDDN